MLDRKYLRRTAVYAAGTLLAIGIAFYVGYHLWRSVSREIETMPALRETFSISEKYDAWIFREEFPITAGGAVSLTAVPSVGDGERVAKGDAVASLYSEVTAGGLNELESVRRQLKLLQGGMVSFASGDFGIAELLLSLKSDTKNNALSGAGDISSRLMALIAASAARAGGDVEALAASLTAKEDQIKSSFGVSGGTVYTPEAGWYYGSADGYESVFTPDAAAGISPDGLDALLTSPAADISGTAGRLVTSYKWYAAAIMPSRDAAFFSEGADRETSLSELTETLDMTVESIVNAPDGRAAVVFSCGFIPDGFDIGRHVKLEPVLQEIEGYGIPKEALRILDGVTGVYTFNGVSVSFRRVEIAAEYDDIYLVYADDPYAETESVDANNADDADNSDDADDADDADFGTDTDGASGEDTGIGIAEGSGRKEYRYLTEREFIIIKGKALYSGKIIG